QRHLSASARVTRCRRGALTRSWRRARFRIAIAHQHDEQHAKVQHQQCTDRDCPPRLAVATLADLHVGERRPDLPLPLVLRLLQRVENEAHHNAPGLSCVCATSSGAPAELVTVSSTICVCTPAMPSTLSRCCRGNSCTL